MSWLRKASAVDWDLVRAVAEQVRGGAMSGHYDEPGELPTLGPSNRIYSGDEKYPHNPGEDTGGCDQMSELLVDTLSDLGIPARTVYGWFKVGPPGEMGGNFEHVWAEVQGRVVDITADQFNEFMGRGEERMPRVYISGGPDPRYTESR